MIGGRIGLVYTASSDRGESALRPSTIHEEASSSNPRYGRLLTPQLISPHSLRHSGRSRGCRLLLRIYGGSGGRGSGRR